MLTTLVKVKAFLHLDIIDDDTLITNLIDRIDSQIKRGAKKTLEAADFTEKYDGDGTDTILVSKYPINFVTSLKIGTEIIASADFFIYGDVGSIVLDGLRFARGRQNIEIVYNAGFTPVPAELEKAAICLVAADYLSSQSSIHTTEAEDVVDRRDGLREQAAEILKGY